MTTLEQKIVAKLKDMEWKYWSEEEITSSWQGYTFYLRKDGRVQARRQRHLLEFMAGPDAVEVYTQAAKACFEKELQDLEVALG